MEIKHIERGGRGAFVVRVDGKRRAQMSYAATDDGFVIDHTEVDESLRGQKVGDKLLAEAVQYARDHGFKISATCTFALKKLRENKEYTDVFSE
jgi:predicted GNAT family acetyltransferase